VGHVRSFEHQHQHAVASEAAYGSGLREFWNPLRPLFSFADAQAIVSGISTQFGTFWEPECESLMQSLESIDREGNGRVAMWRFYAKSLGGGEWRFQESVEWLREIGALDETSRLVGPQVMSSNYVQSSTNCVVAQKHFRICCASPCHNYYAELEAAIGAPEGVPEDILAIVANLTYGFDDEAPKITRSLKAQLQDIARENEGMIPLHGRLFAQWLHFVFPTECPFPHKAGTISGLSPHEVGQSKYMATKAEMRSWVQRGRVEHETKKNGTWVAHVQKVLGNSTEGPMDMWSHEEELLSHRLLQSRPSAERRSLLTTLRPFLHSLAILAVFVIAVLQPAMSASKEARENGFSLGGLLSSMKEEIDSSPWRTKEHFV